MKLVIVIVITVIIITILYQMERLNTKNPVIYQKEQSLLFYIAILISFVLLAILRFF